MLFALWKGIVLGLSIAAPVGPIGILCIRRTVALSRLHGFLSGLGAATADALYGFAAGFGLTLIMNMLLEQKLWLQAIGGLFLCYLGVRTFLSNPASDPANAAGDTLLGSYFSTFLLTIANPMTVLSFLGIFAGIGIGSAGENINSAIALVVGVFLGSALWWFALCFTVGLFRERLNVPALKWINRISGSIVVLFGVVSFIGLLR
ncbi:lysine transporter LysE [Paenibacillus sp. A3]|uniref:LysE/ArgO family amino acid transporter n=1 Tax=Paenibacillus sp. A3 TaxID=1337054 RepID=UPI0006D53AF2|nr:LysE family transporter [Paenibacillus sp. A3]KPV61335.1 lysine transporter LysE [Paenibacillus sp. A3]